MIDQRFMQSLADDLKGPMLDEETTPEMVLAAGPARTDAPQAFVGTRLNVPKAGQPQPTTQDRQRLGIQLFDALAAMPKGAVQATVGLPGDLESIGRTVLDYFGYNVNQETALPTSEDISKKLESTFGPVVPKGQTTIVPTAERERAAKSGETVGEFLPAPGIPEAVVRGGKLIRRGIQATKDMPVGMSTQMVGEGVSDLGFYSAAKQAVDSIQQPKGTGEQFLKQIEKTPGVKPEEIKWTGLDDFLKSKKSVTKAEVQEFLDKNRVEIKEVQLGSGENPYPYRTPDEWQGAIDRAERARDFDEAERLTLAWEAFEGLGSQTKFSKYTLPGGENYREILITLPTREQGGYILGSRDGDAVLREFKNYDQAFNFYQSQPQSDRLATYIKPKNTSPEFKSQHFDQPNILAHMRVNDRVDADGKKVLFIEEVQSDWHQAGRKKGYQVKQSPQDLEVRKTENGYGVFDKNRNNLISEHLTEEKASESMSRVLEARPTTTTGVPDAPFKTTWHELAMKRAIQLAAEGGYDRVAFTTGKTQAERYDLSKQVKMISAMPDKNGKYNIYIEGKDGDPVFRNTNGFSEYGQKVVTPEEFEELVGKDAAKTIMQKADELNRGKVSKDQFKFYDSKPADLTIGGEGMKGFYDQILPKFLDKYAKKWDAKTGMTKIQTESKAQAMADANLLEELGTPRDKIDTSGMVSVQYIDVTPKMKESVLTKGQPLFAIGASGAAVQQEENQ